MLRIIVQIIGGITNCGVIVGRRAAVLGQVDVGMVHQIILVIQHGALTTNEQDTLAVVQHAYFIRRKQFPTGLLVVDRVASVSAFGMAVGVCIQCLLAHELGHIFVRFFLVPS